MDELTELEQQGCVERREYKRLVKKDPEALENIKKGRMNKRKGIKKEMALEELLYRYGFIRKLDSGVLTGGDVVRVIDDGKVLKVGENKFRHTGSGFEMLYRYFEQSRLTDFVVVGKANAKRLFVVPEDIFIQLLQEAGYDNFNEQTKGFAEWQARAEKEKFLGGRCDYES